MEVSVEGDEEEERDVIEACQKVELDEYQSLESSEKWNFILCEGFSRQETTTGFTKLPVLDLQMLTFSYLMTSGEGEQYLIG